MRDISLEELLVAGCHFGHQVNRRNPKADEYIFEERSGVHIINLEKTREGLISAGNQMREIASRGGYVIVVGTKRQAKEIVEAEVKRAKDTGAAGLFYVTSRWVGGTLTNFSEVSKNFKKLKELTEFLKSGKSGDYTKRELLLMDRAREKLSGLYGGIMDLDRIPDALCIIGTQLEQTAVSEGQSNKVDIIGIVDTNSDPVRITHPIPANDDAVGSIKLITTYLIDAWIEGVKKGADDKQKAAEKKIQDEEKEKVAKEKKAEKPVQEEKEVKPKKAAKTTTKK